MMEPTYGKYDVDSVPGIDKLRARLADAQDDRDLSFILADYIQWGNNKVAKSVAIFNMNAATDCPNADTSEDDESSTGVCQVPWSACYAHKAENMYPQALPYRRRQEYLWDALTADEWAGAFKELIGRKRNPVTDIRFSEAGDFRSEDDIQKVNDIAKYMVTESINVYTYSASHKLDWSGATHFTVNQSNALANYGHRRFAALPVGSDLPENTVWCPYDVSDGDIKCGECRLCINPTGPDVAIELH